MKLLIFSVLVSISGLDFAHANSGESQFAPLMGFTTSRQGVVIQTPTGGCTAKNSYTTSLDRSGEVTRLMFSRVRQDQCLALYNYGIGLFFSYEELGLGRDEAFMVVNPLTFTRALSL